MFPEDSLYIVGNAKVQQHNPIALQYGQFFLGLVVEKESECIIECEASVTLPLTGQFIRSLLLGKRLLADAPHIQRAIEGRYFGSSAKAIMVAVRDAQKKYQQICQGLLPLE